MALKEWKETTRDRLILLLAFLLPALWLVVFGYGLNLDVENIPFAVLDRDRSELSRDYLHRFGNFTRAVLFVIVAYPFFAGSAAFGNRGILLAAVSGALASGIGYLIWFKVLEYHTATRAAVVQLAVPAIAAAGGVVFLDETFTLRLLFAGLAILGGILLTIPGRSVSRSAEGGN